MTPAAFEIFCAETLRTYGWEVLVTPLCRDQGVDVIAQKNGVRVVLCCNASCIQIQWVTRLCRRLQRAGTSASAFWRSSHKQFVYGICKGTRDHERNMLAASHGLATVGTISWNGNRTIELRHFYSLGDLTAIESDLLARTLTLVFNVGFVRDFHSLSEETRFVVIVTGVKSVGSFRGVPWPGGCSIPAETPYEQQEAIVADIRTNGAKSPCRGLISSDSPITAWRCPLPRSVKGLMASPCVLVCWLGETPT